MTLNIFECFRHRAIKCASRSTTKSCSKPIVQSSVSIAEVSRQLGLKPSGGNHRMISTRLRLLNISTGHFKGQGWAKGESAITSLAIARLTVQKAIPDEAVFVKNSPLVYGQRIIKRMLRLGWKYLCAECGLSEWCGKPISLHLDHLNGISNDNRLENLRLLCPNCHSQTPTYCRRKK